MGTFEASAVSPAIRGLVRPVSVAPMMDRTDRWFRVMMRQLTRHTLLYTEMVTTGAVLHGNRTLLLGFDPVEHPLALQLGGDDPAALATCARIAEDLGYDEVNLNVGCPSSRVRAGCFGAVLMRHPERVAEAVAAMRAVVAIPVTVKHRIGVDELDRYEDMARFVDVVATAGADRFSVHARKAWLDGLSPKENRTIPPLRYDDVYRLKADRPDLVIEVNGGIRDADAIAGHLERVDAVMIGRAAYEHPAMFAEVDRRFFDPIAPVPSRVEVVEALLPVAERLVASGEPVHRLTRHLLALFTGIPGARVWRRTLTVGSHTPGAGAEVVVEALRSVLRPGTARTSPSDSGVRTC